MNGRKGKDMYNDARRTRGKDGNMDTQQHFERDTISATKTEQVNIGDIVMIKGGSKNRGHWKISMIPNFLMGKTKL